MSSTDSHSVLLFYQYFTPLLSTDGVLSLIEWQQELCTRLHLSGRVLISEQGVNGTLAGTLENTAIYEKNVEQHQWKDHTLFVGIQWKRSVNSPGQLLPFPDLRVRRVNEIVSSGGTIPWNVANPTNGGTHLGPEEFHTVLDQAIPDDNLVVLDVRNRWEHAVGHFTDAAGRPAVHPNMRNFTQFKEYVDTHGPMLFKDKKVLMYCTGGIRCETASAYLMSTGIAKEVCQLQGGIHTYCEERTAAAAAAAAAAAVFINTDTSSSTTTNCVIDDNKSSDKKSINISQTSHSNYFLGSNFVFDRRAVLPGGSGIVVGTCTECDAPYDQFDGAAVCTACVCPVLVCQNCRQKGVEALATKMTGFVRKEWFCQSHRYLAESYYYCLDFFDVAELSRQKCALMELLKTNVGVQIIGGKQGEETKLKNWRDKKVLQRQINRLGERTKKLKQGETNCLLRNIHFEPLCRCCSKENCDGRCWGFWKSPTKIQTTTVLTSSTQEVSGGE